MSLFDKEIAQIIADAESMKEHRRLAEQIAIERKAYEDIKGLITEVKELTNGRAQESKQQDKV